MKIRELHITGKWVDVPGRPDQYEVAVYPSIGAYPQMLSVGQCPEPFTIPCTLKKETYSVHHVYHPGTVVQHYSVKMSDKGLLSDILMIENELLEKLLAEERKQEYLRWRDKLLQMELESYRQEKRAIMRIRNLPWYKRLFKQF